MKEIIEQAWNERKLLQEKESIEAIKELIAFLDEGKIRVAEETPDGWVVNQWIKKGIILYFLIQELRTIEVGPFEFYDKIPLKKEFAEKRARLFLMR